jgi:hypothetical protein
MLDRLPQYVELLHCQRARLITSSDTLCVRSIILGSTLSSASLAVLTVGHLPFLQVTYDGQSECCVELAHIEA